MKSKTSLVWTESRVELDSVTTVDLQLSLVVFPDYTELDDSLGNGDDLECSLVFWVGFEKGAVLES